MEGLLVDLMMAFDVTKPMAILVVANILSIPMIIFLFVRVGFHAMHFDVLKDDVHEAKKDARRSADRAHEAVITVYRIIDK